MRVLPPAGVNPRLRLKMESGPQPGHNDQQQRIHVLPGYSTDDSTAKTFVTKLSAAFLAACTTTRYSMTNNA